LHAVDIGSREWHWPTKLWCSHSLTRVHLILSSAPPRTRREKMRPSTSSMCPKLLCCCFIAAWFGDAGVEVGFSACRGSGRCAILSFVAAGGAITRLYTEHGVGQHEILSHDTPVTLLPAPQQSLYPAPLRKNQPIRFRPFVDVLFLLRVKSLGVTGPFCYSSWRDTHTGTANSAPTASPRDNPLVCLDTAPRMYVVRMEVQAARGEGKDK